MIYLHQYWFKLVAVFGIGIITEMFALVKSSLITTLGPAESCGIRGSVFESIASVGDLVAPLILGAALDILGYLSLSFVLSAVAIVLGVIYFFRRTSSDNDNP